MNQPKNRSWAGDDPSTRPHGGLLRANGLFTCWVTPQKSARPEPVEGWADFSVSKCGFQDQSDLTESVIPGLTRNPVVHLWLGTSFGRIPAFAGMTWLSFVFDMTSC